MILRVGTSGFSYDEWKGPFYPSNLSNKRMLRFYGEKFPAVEINNTFYRMPKPEMLARWMSEVPPDFRFALKAPGHITHAKKPKNTQETLKQLMGVAATLGDHLGPVLFQFPPTLEKDLVRLEPFLSVSQKGPKVAFEFRHASWYDDELFRTLRDVNAALCIAESEEGSWNAPFVATADFGYIRLRTCNYDEVSLGAWTSRIRSQEWSDAYVFFKHEDEATGPLFASMLQRSWG